LVLFLIFQFFKILGPDGYFLAWLEIKESSFYFAVLDRLHEPWIVKKLILRSGTFSEYHQMRYDTQTNVFYFRKVLVHMCFCTYF
jgi:hypothetical protein